MLENRKQTKQLKHDRKCDNKEYHNLDDVINDACLLSDLRKPSESKTTTDEDGRTTKKTKLNKLSPILFMKIELPSGKKKNRTKTRILKALVDTGASESILLLSKAKHLPLRKTKESKSWSTAAGTVDTTLKSQSVAFTLPELHANRTIEKSFHVLDVNIENYDMLIGRDLITSLGLEIRGNDLSIKWDDAAIPWRSQDSTKEDIFLADDLYSNEPIEQEIKRMTDILDAKYAKADLRKVVDAAVHLTNDEQESLYTLLKKYEDLFDGTLGEFTGKPYDIKLKDNIEPFHSRPFPVPRIHEFTLKSELDRLCSLGVLKRVNRAQCGAPTFIIPKKDGTVRFILDFRELNKRIKRQPYPIPKI